PDNRVDKSERSGLELSLRLAPTDTIDLVASYTHLDASEPAGIEVRRPEQQGAIDASWRPGASGTRAGRLQLNLGLTYNGEQVDTDFGTFLRTGMDAYTLLRLGASWQVSDTIEIYGRIENATDADYEEIIGHRGAPQGVFVGMRLKDRRSN